MSIPVILIGLLLLAASVLANKYVVPGKFVIAIVISSGLLVTGILARCVWVVDPAWKGFVVTLGHVNGEVLSEGPHFTWPWSEVIQVSTKTYGVNVADSEGGTHDIQSVHTDMAVNYRYDPLHVIEIYKTIGLVNDQYYIEGAAKEVFKAVTAQYTSEELITKRSEASAKVRALLGEKLSKYYIIVSDVNMTNFKFSHDFATAVEQKVVAAQNRERASILLDKAKIDANARIAQAKGEAEAIQIQSQAIQANGGAAYVQLQAIEKWNGQLPEYVGGSGPLPMLNLK